MNNKKIAVERDILYQEMKKLLIESSLPDEEKLGVIMRFCLSLLQVTQANLIEMRTSDNRKLSLFLEKIPAKLN